MHYCTSRGLPQVSGLYSGNADCVSVKAEKLNLIGSAFSVGVYDDTNVARLQTKTRQGALEHYL